MSDEVKQVTPAPAARPPGAGARPPVASVVTVDRIAAARDEAEVYRLGVGALSASLAPARCLVFDRDEYGQLRLAQRWDSPGRPEPAVSPSAVANQVQRWWMGVLQAGGDLQGCRPTTLEGQQQTYVLPLLAGELLHGMVVAQDCKRPLDGATEREVIAVATTMSLTLHAGVLRGRLEEAVLPEQVAEAITQERRRIAREIHDGVAQGLGYLLLKTELLDRLVERDPAGAREQAALIRATLQQSIGDLRRCIGDLRRPSAEQMAGITGQLRSLVGNLGEMPNLELALQQVSGVRLAPEVERTVIGIVREALHNIRKHANANAVRVEVQREGDQLHVLVADDGQGFEPGQEQVGPDPHFGVKQMRELAQEMGGDLSINSAPGTGARVEAVIPVHPVRANQLNQR